MIYFIVVEFVFNLLVFWCLLPSRFNNLGISYSTLMIFQISTILHHFLHIYIRQEKIIFWWWWWQKTKHNWFVYLSSTRRNHFYIATLTVTYRYVRMYHIHIMRSVVLCTYHTTHCLLLSRRQIICFCLCLNPFFFIFYFFFYCYICIYEITYIFLLNLIHILIFRFKTFYCNFLTVWLSYLTQFVLMITSSFKKFNFIIIRININKFFSFGNPKI